MELIRTEMTPRERLTAYAAGQEVDRIPTVLTAAETSPIRYGIQNKDYYFSADLMVEVESKIAEDFGADNMGVNIGLRGVVEALGVSVVTPENNVSHVEGVGIESYEDLDRMSIIDVTKDGRFPIMLEAYNRLQEKFGKTHIIGTGMAGPFTVAAFLIGTEKFLKDMVKKESEITKLLQFATDNVVAAGEGLYKHAGIKPSIAEPIIARNLLSPRMFKKYAVPFMTQTVERLTKIYGSKPGMHICGTTHDRWQEIVDFGISAFSVDNVESMTDLKNLFGDRIGIIGNVDPVDLLRNGTPEDMKNEVIRCLSEAADNPCGFVLSPGCTTPVGTPKENLVALMNAAATYGKGAKKGAMPEGMKGL